MTEIIVFVVGLIIGHAIAEWRRRRWLAKHPPRFGLRKYEIRIKGYHREVWM